MAAPVHLHVAHAEVAAQAADEDPPLNLARDGESIALAVEAHAAALAVAPAAVTCRWITDEEMAANQHLIRTMSVKPPMGTGRVRLVMIGEDGKVDLQPCGGTHVASTGLIGPVAVTKIENKGKINRRIRVAFQ